MENYSQIYNNVKKKTNNGQIIPVIDKNGVLIHKLNIFEEIIIRNLDNMDTIALEINGNQISYKHFFKEVEKYMSSFINLGLKEGDIVSLCLPVNVEFICSYFALTTLGITVNAINLMFLLNEGVKPYLDERCSKTLMIDKNFYDLLKKKNCFNSNYIKTIIITGDEIYSHFISDKNKITISDKNEKRTEILSFNDFLDIAKPKDILQSVDYNEKRISTLLYTSGTTGKPKCIGHNDVAPLFIIAAHDKIKRDEHKGDRTLLTIPLQHPTGLFYSMVFQMAQGKTLVLEPRYDKRIFFEDIKNLEINHAVQAKSFYAQLIQDRIDGKLKLGDFEMFKNAYSGGEGIPLAVLKQINETLAYAGCKTPLFLGYGRSEEGSITFGPYNIVGRENTCGIPLPGVEAKIVNANNLEDMVQKEGIVGEILVYSPVKPYNNCYLGVNNFKDCDDGSIVCNNKRWARPKDIATLVKMPNGSLSYLVLGRADDYIIKNGVKYYLFEMKERVSNIYGIQECEVLKLNNQNNILTIHLVLNKKFDNYKEYIIRKIYEIYNFIDGIKFYNAFNLNSASGKCDRESMQSDAQNYYTIKDNNIININFEKNNDYSHIKKKEYKL